jgi:hypothetical protein
MGRKRGGGKSMVRRIKKKKRGGGGEEYGEKEIDNSDRLRLERVPEGVNVDSHLWPIY